MRGIPGSGKSTVAKLLASSTESVIHAVDDLHTDEAGVFFWDERLEKQRYDENLANFKRSCERGVEVVICDCMNLTMDDYAPYVDVAEANGYIVVFVSPKLPTVDQAHVRNLHGVTRDHIAEMKARYQAI